MRVGSTYQIGGLGIQIWLEDWEVEGINLFGGLRVNVRGIEDTYLCEKI